MCRKNLFLILSVATLGFISTLAACGGGGSTNPPSPTPPPTPSSAVSITISPDAVSSVVNQKTQFTANVTNATNTAVTWSIKEEEGGAVDNGLYAAPWTAGTYHVVATSSADPSKSASATVSISAPFAFLQEPKGATATPFSLTPMLGTFTPGGGFTTAAINDPATGKPYDAAISEISLSQDGTRAVLTILEPIGYDLHRESIYVMNSDGTGLTKLLAGTLSDYYSDPQFTPDGNIMYIKGSAIWAMNSDGSNAHAIYSNEEEDWVWQVAVSPDNSRIAAAIDRVVAGVATYGIAVMNTDGSNMVILNPSSDPACLDRFPTFTNTGNQIVFSRNCAITDQPVREDLYTMNVDGSNLRLLYPVGGESTINTDPLAVANKIVFPSNRDNLSSTQMDLYSVNLDGTGLARWTSNDLYDAFNYYQYYGASSTSVFPQLSTRREQAQRRQSVGQH